MSKIRVYELAKLLDKPNAEVVELLKGLGVDVKSHMSSIDTETAQLVEDSLRESAAKGEEFPVEQTQPVSSHPPFAVKPGWTVADLAERLDESPASLVKILLMAGMMAPANTPLDKAILDHFTKHFNREFVFDEAAARAEGRVSATEMESAAPSASAETEEMEAPKTETPEKKRVPGGETKAKRYRITPVEGANLQPRSPIVTVMGHVDHGKTTLLDYIRKTRVTEKEAGGITQHIGASTVDYNGKRIVFLDTPGHEAFTSMRARGASVTDIAILVVAADDGVMPQTIEAVNHAKAAEIPIIVAVNKTDKPDAKPDRVRQQLSDHGLAPEEWGGNTIMVDVAAKTGDGVDNLLEMVLLVAEMEELQADADGNPEGVVIESNLDKGKGPVATVIVMQGTLKRGAVIMTGTTWGKIRAMIDSNGKSLDEAGPSTPVEILGFESVPQPGESFRRVASEREAREVMFDNDSTRREQELQKTHRLTLEELYEKMQAGETPQLNLVLKCDVLGSMEAFHSSLMKMSTEAVGINIVHEGVGRISETDVMLAAASNAIVVGFNVRPDANAKKIAETEGVQIRLYQVIYEMLDDIKAAMEGMLAPILKEHVLGQAEIRASFKVPKIGKIAGCRVLEGSITRNSRVRLIRDGIVIWDGTLSSLKHFKEDVREVKAGNECGMSFTNYQDFHEKDVVEAYEILKEKAYLS